MAEAASCTVSGFVKGLILVNEVAFNNVFFFSVMKWIYYSFS